MTRFEVVLLVPGMGKVKHVVKAISEKGANQRALRAHDQARVIYCKRIKDEGQ